MKNVWFYKISICKITTKYMHKKLQHKLFATERRLEKSSPVKNGRKTPAGLFVKEMKEFLEFLSNILRKVLLTTKKLIKYFKEAIRCIIKHN